MITVDEKRCTDCGVCHDVCPSYVFSKVKEREKTTAVRYPELCSSCGHCMSICPVEAITHDAFRNEDFEKNPAHSIQPSDLENLILSRRSVRKYKDREVPDEMINQLINCGVHAGSGGNIQSESFAVIKGRSFLKKLEPVVIDALWDGGIRFFTGKGLLQKVLRKKFGETLSEQYGKYHKIIRFRKENNETEGMIFRRAPAVIIVHGLKENYLAQTNSAIALRNMELMAETMGLGTCHAGFLVSAADMKQKKINKMLGIDTSRKIYGALMIGFPEYKYKKRIPRPDRDVLRIA